MKSHLCKEPAAPDPVRFDRIDHRRDNCGINAVGYKFCPLSHGTRNDRRRRRTKYQIEDKVGPVKAFISRENIKSRLSDKAKHIFSQQKPKPDQDKYHRTDTKIHQVLHQDIPRILSPCKTRLHHGKAGLHPEYQCGANQKPDAEYLTIHYTHQFFCHNISSFLCKIPVR